MKVKTYTQDEVLKTINEFYKNISGLHECANLIPCPTIEDYQRLVDSIDANGLYDPIFIQSGTNLLVDGRSRLMACFETNTDLKIEYISFDSDEKAMIWSLARNVDRRHLTAAQKAIIALNVKTFYSEQAKERKREGGKTTHSNQYQDSAQDRPTAAYAAEPDKNQGHSDKQDDGKANAQAGAATGAKKEYVRMADYIKQFRPDLLQKVYDGIILMRYAYNEAKKNDPNKQQEKPKKSSKTGAETPKGDKFKENMSDAKKELYEKAKAIMIEELKAGFKNAVMEEVKNQLEPERLRLKEQHTKYLEAEKLLRDKIKGIKSIMTIEEFKMIRGCLHSDRANGDNDLKIKLDKAFKAFNKLNTLI